MSRKNNQKYENANMDSLAGKNSLSTNPVKDYIIYEDKVYYIHPIYNNYGASKSGKVINRETLKPFFGTKNDNGYVHVSLKYPHKKQYKLIDSFMNAFME